MLTIRLQRVGRRGIPAHRVVVQDSRQSPKSGRVVENLGSYDTRHDAPQINTERASYWVSQGAQTSGTVHNLLVDLGVVKGAKKNVLPKKTPIVSDEPAEEQTKDAEAPAAEETGEDTEAPVAEETSEDTEAPKEKAAPAEPVAEEKEEEKVEEKADEKNEAEEKPSEAESAGAEAATGEEEKKA
ncbi:MAG: 30S ribosomal protein S16 [Candidatus Paceibacterota bacterium]